MLNEIKLLTIPFFPNIMLGKDISHTKIIDIIGISDHDRLPDTAISQMVHTSIPIKRITENKTAIIIFLAMWELVDFFVDLIGFEPTPLTMRTRPQNFLGVSGYFRCFHFVLLEMGIF